MNDEFWFERWREGRTAFHEGAPNRFLVKYADRLEECQRILVPLCGKATDLAYLASRGHEVVGVELVEDAIRQFFHEQDIMPTAIKVFDDGRKVYTAGSLALIASDFFATTRELVGPIDAVYDRAALVALPAELRPRYAEHIRAIAINLRRQLVISLEYPAGSFDGPPFSVPESEIRALYPGATVEKLDEAPDPRGRGDGNMMEYCYDLRFGSA